MHSNAIAAVRTRIETTDWAKRFLAECPTSYAEAIKLAIQLEKSRDFVSVELREDPNSRGDTLWAVIPECKSDFWLEALPTRQASLAVCREMKWRVRQ